MDILASFLLFIVVPLLVLYSLLRLFLKVTPQLNSKLAAQVARKKWHRLFFFLSLMALTFFAGAFGLWYKLTFHYGDGGMGLVLFIPMLIMTIILFSSSGITWFLTDKTYVRIDTTIFMIMALLAIPAVFLAICSILWVVLIII